MIYIFLGAPGGGKTTQARLLVERQGFELVGVGGLLRQKQEEMPELKARLAGGNLADLDLICQLLDQAFRDCRAADPSTRILVDGFPRSDEQADWLLAHWRDQLQLVWLLDLDPAAARRRLAARGRYDDQSEVIDQRWRVYRSGTTQALDKLRRAGVEVITVDADQPVEAIHRRLIRELDQ